MVSDTPGTTGSASTGRANEHAGQASAFLIPSALLAGTLFLLSADLLFLKVAGNKIKFGYFLLLCLWLFSPAQMFETAKIAVLRTPKWMLLPLIPLAISIATSANPRNSIWWSLWLGFDIFAVVTVYSFLKVRQFSIDRIQTCVAGSLGLIALCGMAQYISIYGFHHVLFNPQLHFNIYRITGVSGWPHFLNIFSFLLLPIVLLQERWPWYTRLMLVSLLFVLVQSTAKTGWALLIALGGLLLFLDRRKFVRRYLLFLVPVVVIALQIPTPSLEPDRPAVSGAEKAVRIAADLHVDDKTTSGSDRMLINEMGLRVWMKHPWFGVGPKAYATYVLDRFDQELPGENKLDANHQVNTKNENIWIEFLSECGMLFTLGFAIVLIRALWVRQWAFANSLHLGSWLALVLYFAISGQVSQSGLLTMPYAVLGIFLYARQLTADNPAAPGRHVP